MTSYTYLGYGTTDSNGVAKLDHDANGDPISHSYTGVGAGEIDLLASTDNPITSSSCQSEPYPVTDAKWIFSGTSYVTSAGVITDNQDGTYTLGTDGTNYALFGASTTSSNTNLIYVSIGGCWEFDVVEYSGAVTLRSNISGSSNRDANNVWEANTHYKIEIIDNGVKINGVTKTFEDTGARSFVFRIENGASITIKNLLYY